MSDFGASKFESDSGIPQIENRTLPGLTASTGNMVDNSETKKALRCATDKRSDEQTFLYIV